ncbi:Uncharacterised protein [Clostridioides difficile]|nr:Uncharacterised protein [Clostridioides difficile]
MWSEWEELATTESAELTLLNGWTLENGEATAIRIGKKVFLDLAVTGGSGNGLPIFTLPFPNKTDQIWNITVQNDKWEMIAQNISTGAGSLNYWGTPTKRVPIHISYTIQ